MAALTADVEVIYDPKSNAIRRQYKVVGADTYFRGALIHITNGTGKADATAANAMEFLGVSDENLIAAAADELLHVWVRGVFFFSGMTPADADLGDVFAATATSDNPADLVVNAVGTPGAMGMVIAVEAGGLWIDIGSRSLVINA